MEAEIPQICRVIKNDINFDELLKMTPNLKQQFQECSTLSSELCSLIRPVLRKFNEDIAQKYRSYLEVRTEFEMSSLNEEIEEILNSKTSDETICLKGSICQLEQHFKKEIDEFQNLRATFLKNCIKGFKFLQENWITSFNNRITFHQSKIITKANPDFEVVLQAFHKEIVEHNATLERKVTKVGTYITLSWNPK